MSYDPCRAFRKLAHNSRLANLRLHHACLQLSQEAFVAQRTSFFPSIRATLNHMHIVDVFYADALKGGTLGYAAFERQEPYTTAAGIWAAQDALDRELIDFVDGLLRVILAQRCRCTEDSACRRTVVTIF